MEWCQICFIFSPNHIKRSLSFSHIYIKLKVSTTSNAYTRLTANIQFVYSMIRSNGSSKGSRLKMIPPGIPRGSRLWISLQGITRGYRLWINLPGIPGDPDCESIILPGIPGDPDCELSLPGIPRKSRLLMSLESLGTGCERFLVLFVGQRS